MRMSKNYLNYMFLSTMIILSNCLGYLGHLAIGQSEILWNRERISELIGNSNDGEFVQKLKLVEDARQFAASSLYLNPKGGFEYFTKLDRKEVGWHVTASYPLKFESYTWWFPIVGSVPYKGYFDLEKARVEEQELSEKGLDTRLRITSGYSTLGWFSDPLLSPQLKLRDDELVALVFHEMAHGTVYFNGDGNFNESYASFVEEIGTEIYYETKGGVLKDKILPLRQQVKREKKIIFEHIKTYGALLKSLYETEESDDFKQNRKKEIIEEFRTTISEKQGEFKIIDSRNFSTMKINNETFISVLRYNSGEEFFKNKYEEVNRDLEKFHDEMRKLTGLSKEERKKLLKIN